MVGITGVAVFGQASYKKLIDAGNEAFEDGNFYAAMQHYNNALEKDNDDVDLWYKFAQAALKQFAYDRARMAYTFIIEDLGSTEYPDALFDLASLSVTNEDYQKAEKYFQKYINDFGGEDELLDKKAALGLESAIWVQDQLDKPVRNSTHLGKEVNSPYSEHSPVWFDDELNFVSLKYGRNETGRLLSKVLVKKDSLSSELPLAANFNENSYLTSDPSFSDDGFLMFYTKCTYDENNEIRCKIFYRRKIDDAFTLGVNTSKSINLEGYTSTHPTIVENGGKRYLYFTSDRPNGLGGFDIWYSEIQSNMRFSEPVNADDLNTEFDEITPHYQKGSNLMYFSTNGRVGFGGFDVYQAKLNTDNTFSVFDNLGLSTNSSYHDLHFYESDDGQHSYLSSNRKGSFYSDNSFETCCYDIYEVEPKRCDIDVVVMVFDATDNSPLNGSTVSVVKQEDGNESLRKDLSNSNEIETYLDCIKDYTITAEKEAYIPARAELLYSKDGLKLDEARDTVRLFLEPAIVSLRLKVYDEETKEPLNEATLILIDQETMSPIQKYNLEGNDFTFSVLPGKNYILKSSRSGYIPSEINIGIPVGKKIIEKDVYLQKTPIEKKIVTLKEVLPIRLFFDNDQPNPKTMITTTTIRYSDTYEPYYARKEKFKSVYASKFRNVQKDEARQAVDNFFEGELRRNKLNLNKFMKTLLEVLQAGRTVNLYFRGYASPLSVSEYNFNLGKRRVESMLLELKNYGDGMFIPYIESGQIILTERSFGETSAPSGVSDDFSDLSGSIFSPEASFERRVEIQEIEVNREQ